MSNQFQFSAEDLQRINVVGTSSSGKTTFSRQLATVLDVPCVEMDSLFHEPNWTEAPIPVFRERLVQATDPSAWVLDGNYHSKTHDIKWSRATMILWLDMPFTLNMYRAITRAIHRAWTQEELWPGTGNRESFRQTFLSTDSMILWTASSFWRLKKRYGAIERSPPANVVFVRLQGRHDAQRFLEHVKMSK